MTIEKITREFLEDLELERGRSPKTIENYDHYLKRFFMHAKVSNPAHISDELVRSYRLALNRTGLSPRTRNYHLIALRMFLKYLAKRDIKSLAPERVELAKLGDRDIDIPHEGDLDRLLGAPKTDALQGLRDRAILELLFSTGLRVSELCALNRDSLDLGRDEFSVRGKGSKIRIVFLSKDAKDAIRAYLAKRGDMSDALFAGTQKKNPARLTSRQIERLVKRYAIGAGIPGKVTPHTLRHLFATDLLLNGADIRSVQAMLGHSSITTTQIYTHMTDRQLREVHKAFHGKRRK
ncbi:MAG: site-specific tyrosine recombinase/integron integrase [Patescibacteria group bacterium]